MAIPLCDYNEHDQRIWDEELDGFIPSKVHDAHCHLMDWQFMPSDVPRRSDRQNVDLAGLESWSQTIHPGRQMNYLLLGMPLVGMDEEPHTQWMARQIADHPDIRMHRLVTPRCSLAAVEKSLDDHPQIVGLKPYRIFSVTGDIHNCRIHDFLPHEQLELANDRGLSITMHLSQSDGCADADNLKDLHEYTHKRYPRIRWILAHCARSFTYYAIAKAVDQLRDMPNIWYDLSAVTDVRPHLTLFTKEDHRRILYGSDGVDATNFHGSYGALGRSWQYFDASKMNVTYPHTKHRPVLCIYEQLLAIKHAAEIARLSTQQVQDIFWNNARRFLNLPEA